MSNPTQDSTPRVLVKVYARMSRNYMDGIDDFKPSSEAKKKIDNYISKHYLSKEQVLEIIGEDELQGMKTPLQWEIAQDRNAYRAEQRLRLEEKL